VHPLDRGTAERKRIRVFGLSIVNGAQTLGSVAKSFARARRERSESYVFLKVISLERCVDEREFARRITQSTNFQNQIGARDFVALDEQQERIAAHLRLEGVGYHYKDDADTVTQDAANFTVKEASQALAALEWGMDGDLCAKAVGDPSALFSLDQVYPADRPPRTRYHRLFRPERSARTVWRAVQTWRAVVRQMQADGRAATGRIRKDFFENARALVLSIIFVRLRPELGEDTSLSADELAEVTRMAIQVAESLWEVCEASGLVSRNAMAGVDGGGYDQVRHFRAVFSSAADCHRLRDGTMAKLA
jgi:hypothetical protein